MIQFIFVDLDGTFLNSDKQVTVESLKTIQKIKKEYSVQFGIASGRALTSLIPMLKEQNLENIVDVHFPSVVFHKFVIVFFPFL